MINTKGQSYQNDLDKPSKNRKGGAVAAEELDTVYYHNGSNGTIRTDRDEKPSVDFGLVREEESFAKPIG